MLNPNAIARIAQMREEDDTLAHHAMVEKIVSIIVSREPRETDTMVLASIEDVINEMASRFYR